MRKRGISRDENVLGDTLDVDMICDRDASSGIDVVDDFMSG